MSDLAFNWRKDLFPQRGRQGSKDEYNFVGSRGDVRRGESCLLVSVHLRMKNSHLR